MANYKLLSAVISAVMLCMVNFSANASPIVWGSIYDIYITDDDGLRYQTYTFDGVDEVYDGMTISESVTDLGYGAYKIDISIASISDIFPALGGGRIGIGVFDQLDVVNAVKIIRGELAFWGMQNDLIASYIVPPRFTSPWDGSSPGPSSVWVPSITDANAIGSTKFTFYVAVPEPASIAMASLGLSGLIALRRRKVNMAA